MEELKIKRNYKAYFTQRLKLSPWVIICVGVPIIFGSHKYGVSQICFCISIIVLMETLVFIRSRMYPYEYVVSESEIIWRGPIYSKKTLIRQYKYVSLQEIWMWKNLLFIGHNHKNFEIGLDYISDADTQIMLDYFKSRITPEY